jgi:hypothetical protein
MFAVPDFGQGIAGWMIVAMENAVVTEVAQTAGWEVLAVGTSVAAVEERTFAEMGAAWSTVGCLTEARRTDADLPESHYMVDLDDCANTRVREDAEAREFARCHDLQLG